MWIITSPASTSTQSHCGTPSTRMFFLPSFESASTTWSAMALTWRLERPDATTMVSAIVDFRDTSMVTIASALLSSSCFNTASTMGGHDTATGAATANFGVTTFFATTFLAAIFLAATFLTGFFAAFFGAAFFGTAFLGAAFFTALRAIGLALFFAFTAFFAFFLAGSFADFLVAGFLAEAFTTFLAFTLAFGLATAFFDFFFRDVVPCVINLSNARLPEVQARIFRRRLRIAVELSLRNGMVTNTKAGGFRDVMAEADPSGTRFPANRVAARPCSARIE